VRRNLVETVGTAEYWAGVYSSKAADSVSWYQAEPELSLEMIARSAAPPARVIDVGGGASYLVDRLLEHGYATAVLDIAAEPLELVKARLGKAARHVDWIVADVTTFNPSDEWDVWHDRAVFHFLTGSRDRSRYRQTLMQATKIGSSVIVATFGPAGPDRCSGLPTVRYTPEELHRELGQEFELTETAAEEHETPGGGIQSFIYCRFRRI
jgi:hypothetical protein